MKVNRNCYKGEWLLSSEERFCTTALSSQSQFDQAWNVIMGNLADTIHRNHELYHSQCATQT